jgi:hypothetical protein
MDARYGAMISSRYSNVLDPSRPVSAITIISGLGKIPRFIITHIATEFTPPPYENT